MVKYYKQDSHPGLQWEKMRDELVDIVDGSGYADKTVENAQNLMNTVENKDKWYNISVTRGSNEINRIKQWFKNQADKKIHSVYYGGIDKDGDIIAYKFDSSIVIVSFLDVGQEPGQQYNIQASATQKAVAEKISNNL